MVIALIMQRYVGGNTLYSPELSVRRDSAHSHLLNNRLPPGKTWSDYGGKGTQARALTVWVVEGIHRQTGMGVQRVYFWLDTVALFAGLLALFSLLRSWVPPPLALVGLLYVGVVLPLTYALHYFHPWDRISFLLWIGLIGLLRRERLILFAALLLLAMFVKYDVILLPGLYFLIHFQRRPVAATLTTAALFILTVGAYFLLVQQFGSGLGGERMTGTQIATNLNDMRGFLIWYPPLLGFALPLGLAAVGFRHADQFARASAVFAVLFCIPLFLLSNFVEIRAEMPVLVLLLPAALQGLRRVLEADSGPPQSARAAA
jgi:hypothetical protein